MADHGSVLDLSFSRVSFDVKFCIIPIRIGGVERPGRGRFLPKRSLLTSLSSVEFDADFDVMEI